MEKELPVEPFGSESDLSDSTSVLNYSNTSITLSEMSVSSDKSDSSYEDNNKKDKGVQVNMKLCYRDIMNQYYANLQYFGQPTNVGGGSPTKHQTSRTTNNIMVNINSAQNNRVSLWVDGEQNENQNQDQTDKRTENEEDQSESTNPVVILSKEKVTLRINPGRQERRLSDATLYEDIEDAAEYFSNNFCQSVSPPPLPPRLVRSQSEFNCDKMVKRKNLNHHLGIDDQIDLNNVKDANANTLRNLQENGRVRSKKDLTKFLGINEVKLRKKPFIKKYTEHRRPKSIIDNILSAKKHFRSSKDNDQSNLDESFDQFVSFLKDQDQQLKGQIKRTNLEKYLGPERDVLVIEDLDNLDTSKKIVLGNENDDEDVFNTGEEYDKCRTSSFSSVASSHSSSSTQSSSEHSSAKESSSSFSKILRKSSRRFSTSGIELMESIRRKSSFGKKCHIKSSMNNLPIDSSDSIYKDESCIQEFLAKGMPVIPFDQPLMALMDAKKENSSAHQKEFLVTENEDYVSVSDSLETLIKLAKGELSGDGATEASEEPIYIEMSQSATSQVTKPNFNEYMDMDVVQKALSQFKFSSSD